MFDSTSPLPPGPLPNSEFRIRNSEERARGLGDGVRSAPSIIYVNLTLSRHPALEKQITET